MRFESLKDLSREKLAIDTFTSIFSGYSKKLGDNDIDFSVFDKDNNLISYVEVKGRIKDSRDAFPLPVAARKLVKLSDKRVTPVMIWACNDGIFYGKLEELIGECRTGGRKSRVGAANDIEIMVYFDNKNLKFKKYECEL